MDYDGYSWMLIHRGRHNARCEVGERLTKGRAEAKALFFFLHEIYKRLYENQNIKEDSQMINFEIGALIIVAFVFVALYIAWAIYEDYRLIKRYNEQVAERKIKRETQKWDWN